MPALPTATHRLIGCTNPDQSEPIQDDLSPRETEDQE